MATLTVKLSADMSELVRDLERIENGELSVPTVSAFALLVDGKKIKDIPVFLGEE